MLSVENKTQSSAMLMWSVGTPLNTFPYELIHKIDYKSQWSSFVHSKVCV